MAEYNKHLSSQCNLTSQIKAVQDKYKELINQSDI